MARSTLTPEERAEKQRLYLKAWVDRNREKKREHARTYLARHRESEAKRLAEYRERNREKLRVKSKDYYARNKEKHALAVKRWNEANPSNNNERQKRWRAKNPDGHRMKSHRFRSRHPERIKQYAKAHRKSLTATQLVRCARMKTSDAHYTKSDLAAILEFQGYQCVYCAADLREKNRIDHWMPIARGGSNARDNIQVTCPRCNLKKAARDPLEYEAAIGFVRTHPVGAAFNP